MDDRPNHLGAGWPLLVALGSFVLLCLGSRDVGMVWDESQYFLYSQGLIGWWKQGRPLDATSLAQLWGWSDYLNPHPPLMKILSALTASLFRDLLPFPLSFRVAHLAMVSAGLGLGVALLRRTYGTGLALAGVAFVALQPRVLGELLVATHDSMVLLAFWLGLLLAWRIDEAPERRSLRLAFVTVVAIGTATKFTGFLVLLPVGAFFLWRRKWREIPFLSLTAGVALALVWLVTPHKWAGGRAVVEYLTYPFTRTAVRVETQYLGMQYGFDLPWHYFLVMTAVTTPLLVLALPFATPLLRPDRRGPLVAMLFGVAFWTALVHLPSTPRHDGVRQFVSVYPLLGTLALLGLVALQDRLRAAARGRRWAPVAPVVGVLALAIPVVAEHPFHLSSYNEAIGGLRGAERRGMEVTYFFEAIGPEVIEQANALLPPRARLGIAPYWHDLLLVHQLLGTLRKDLVIVDEAKEPADFTLVSRRRSLVDDRAYFSADPMYELAFDDVSLVRLVPAQLHTRTTRGD